MAETASLLRDVAVVLSVAGLTSVTFRWLKQPAIVGYLVAGLLVGPYIPLPLFADPERMQELAEFGVVLVMFSVGLEFRLGRLMRVLPVAGLAALFEIGTMLWLGFAAGRAFGWTIIESVFLGACICISSTMIVAKIYDQTKGDKKLVRFLFSVLIVQDLVAVILIAALTTIAMGSGLETSAMLRVSGRLLGFLALLITVGLLLVPRLVRTLRRLGDPETTLVTIIGLCFLLSLSAHAMGYSVALGAFFAGSLVAESGDGHAIETLIRPVRDLFAAIFFVAVGMTVDPQLAWTHLVPALIVAMIVIVGQFISVSLAAFLSGNGLRRSIGAGLGLGQIGEFSFIIAGIGAAASVARPELFAIVVTVAIVTAFTTPMFVRMSDTIANALVSRIPARLQMTASLYESWYNELRRGRRRTPKLWRSVIALVIDALAVGAVIITCALVVAPLVDEWRVTAGAPAWLGDVVIAVIGLLGVAPFILGLVRLSRRVGQLLAESALPSMQGRPDLANAPRRAFVIVLQLAVLLLAWIPLLAITQPFLPAFSGLLALAVVIGSVVASLWRDASNLDGHVRAGAEVVVEFLGRQGSEGTATTDLNLLLPGLGDIVPVELASEAWAVGRTLAELDVRSRTGASVMAIRRGEHDVLIPTAEERLCAGDVLVLIGSTRSTRAAEVLLVTGTV